MLTPERQQLILKTVKNDHTSKIKRLVEVTGASESTIRRDLDQLEEKGLLRRVHGGASLRSSASEEPPMIEKITKFHNEKKAIAKSAASLVQDGDCIFIDAGSTTYEMIPLLKEKNIIVVTNGLSHLDVLNKHQIKTYVLGGHVKHQTGAVVGAGAIKNLQQYRFDQCFIGANGVTLTDGYTTPDPDEAAIKQMTLTLSTNRYILVDHSKFEEVAFLKFADLSDAEMITNYNGKAIEEYRRKTNIKVVTT
ncbi:transcriptional regulator, DeoR family [Halobacillus karajensis]|uniref:Lactose phosphotransferase system repressor n=1 Tax=Halobacillus karajensis TaxID=195088 RepID=A0A059NYR5_9BACI|nr:DeoR/GlpR family DNA-binding transcription regulator [Halobacillus karajensis]CDQ19284.1 Lactose phosphotransferase system repressor [Halobacillus karajensis]CDQ22642.1 Lactose phosphotransferase system repressor [Halobacillus karajensis]CDQ26124.1 Lactose phosphotransferase system repressor [Halobacillus karajensis]SEH38865.1 transcriptional regulator, DeoR family [Halobacillus karajensis]